jgi:hypothetical protein
MNIEARIEKAAHMLNLINGQMQYFYTLAHTAGITEEQRAYYRKKHAEYMRDAEYLNTELDFLEREQIKIARPTHHQRQRKR